MDAGPIGHHRGNAAEYGLSPVVLDGGVQQVFWRFKSAESGRMSTARERRIMQAATIRLGSPQGHADERSVQCWDKIPGL